ncbi:MULTISPECIES: N-acetylmuramoyl-L-alanine amidase [Tepidanaerobacter]|uniref:N-acetylmuramoyl-L-alanine amidase n=1 Tax=Tepidanaerobacter TaxID=499228 RepID=UPI001BD418AF|nr:MULTISPECIES: N-acetylmuramoyl-L-alanine amidase [Tepidanaerobacter]
MEIKWVGSPNYTSGRKGKKIIAIVNHITAGDYPGCLSWMQNPKAQASAHYLITKAGKILQLVKESDTAWHAGAVNKPNWKYYDGTNPNYYTIGIEHEGFPETGITEAQYQATLWLQKQIIQRYDIPIDSDHIIGHYRIDSVNRPNCPGPKFPWTRLFNDLRGDDNLDKVTLKDVIITKTKFGNEELSGYIIGGKTYVEFRKLCEILGLKVVWNEKTFTSEVRK